MKELFSYLIHFKLSVEDGIAVVDPDAIASNDLPPPVAIEEFILDNRSQIFRGDAQIPVGIESFEIHYTGLSFIRPEQVNFKYKLAGLDKDWIDAGTRRTAYYSHVPPGSYTFTAALTSPASSRAKQPSDAKHPPPRKRSQVIAWKTNSSPTTTRRATSAMSNNPRGATLIVRST